MQMWRVQSNIHNLTRFKPCIFLFSSLSLSKRVSSLFFYTKAYSVTNIDGEMFEMSEENKTILLLAFARV